MRHLFLYFITLFLLIGCGGGGSTDNTPTSQADDEQTTTKEVYSQYTNSLEYLNNFRKNAGMTEFTSNSLLNSSAQNHAEYLVENTTTGHGEVDGNTGFTGTTPTARAYYVDYKTSISENIAYSSTYEKSIDSLFTAIYHRFGFLDFNSTEIGIGHLTSTNQNASVFNMGIKALNDLCEGTSFDGTGLVYSNVCKDSTFKIEESVYLNAKNKNNENNPSIVVWPYENQQDFQTVFYEENPDPLENCSVSGNPISVKFNDNIEDTIKMTSFKLYDNENNEITNTTVYDENTDPNDKFSNKEFALFPLKRLEWDSKYKAIFEYTQNDVAKTKTWSFKTKDIDYPYYIVESMEEPTLMLKSDTQYAIYIKPDDCNDTGNGISLSSTSTTLSQENDRIDSQTLLFTLKGNIGDTLTLTLHNNTEIKLQISNSDTATR